MSDSRHAKNTADVVAVAVDLWLKIKPEDDEEGEEGGDVPTDKPTDEGDEGNEGEGGEEGDKPSGKPSDKPDGDKTKGKPKDEGDKAGGTGSGKGAVQNIEAGDLIEEQARKASPSHVFRLPLRTKAIVGKFNWR